MVVGTNIATCFESITALNAALIATSVFPNPTSPQRSLSMQIGFSISFLISFTQRSWSSVSSKGNLYSNSFCHSVSFEKAYPFNTFLSAYSLISSLAIFSMAAFERSLVFIQSELPILLSLGFSESVPIYF